MCVKILGVERLGNASVRNGEKWRSVKHAMGCVDERAMAEDVERKSSEIGRIRTPCIKHVAGPTGTSPHA